MEKTQYNTKGFTLWFTGLPCSGKSTVADEVAVKLKEKGVKVVYGILPAILDCGSTPSPGAH